MTRAGRRLKVPSPSNCCACTTCSPSACGWIATTASGYWRVTEDGLFQFGHSKDHRPDLPQVKVMLSVLDPLGLPVATDVVPGQRADDPLYLPAIARVRESVGRRGLLYVGDCKMGALETRAFLQAGETPTCVPWRRSSCRRRLGGLRGVRVRGVQPLTRITRLTATGTRQHLADGYERWEPLTAEVAGKLALDGTTAGGALAPAGPRGERGAARTGGQGPGRGRPPSTRGGGASRGSPSCPRCRRRWRRS